MGVLYLFMMQACLDMLCKAESSTEIGLCFMTRASDQLRVRHAVCYEKVQG